MCAAARDNVTHNLAQKIAGQAVETALASRKKNAAVQ
jgi:hypothetical protein